ncbi:DUF6194 family protein [Streptomyces sp. NBC_01538]|uniref:DUF6194 family protein n=1 Tax=Streptomyces sp. NBC_01538 TaxID=2903897 RepID=UPI00386C1701
MSPPGAPWCGSSSGAHCRPAPHRRARRPASCRPAVPRPPRARRWWQHTVALKVTAAQPFVTVVTKNYPGDEASRLDQPDIFRVNIAAGKEAFIRWTGHAPREPASTDVDPSTTDTVIAHPVYGSVGWLAVVNPGERTEASTRELLQAAEPVKAIKAGRSF